MIDRSTNSHTSSTLQRMFLTLNMSSRTLSYPLSAIQIQEILLIHLLTQRFHLIRRINSESVIYLEITSTAAAEPGRIFFSNLFDYGQETFETNDDSASIQRGRSSFRRSSAEITLNSARKRPLTARKHQPQQPDDRSDENRCRWTGSSNRPSPTRAPSVMLLKVLRRNHPLKVVGLRERKTASASNLNAMQSNVMKDVYSRPTSSYF